MSRGGKLIVLLLLGLAAPAAAQPEASARALLEETRRELGLPGMAAALWRDGRIVAEVAAGERALGSNVPVQPGDPFHIGSITKPVTATLAARLVARGLISWQDRVSEALGPFLPDLLDDYREVTLADLLAHRGGIAPTPRPDEAARLVRIPSLAERRRVVAALSLAAPPAAVPRRDFLYSNYGYVVAAVMIEQATGRLWEELVREEVLEPLGLASAGFGAPGSPDRLDSPRGHFAHGPIPPNSAIADNAPFARPAGGLHMSMRDLALFGADQLLGARGRGALLERGGYRFLHGRSRGGQGTGWALGPDGALYHDGSNRRWFALLRVIPEERLVIAIAANAAGDDEQRTRDGFWVLSERLRAGTAGD